ncbi:unnamed protein product [Chilo suppressalis]|uniref:PHD-type domain-containing protein n=1 Tax=Chilo suppressalis TaxID=168631 RepID=A0ABN8AZ02_CHISP|nr:unnamed protein product [Chilo suppressalis]
MKNCAACNSKLKDNDHLECSRCAEIYHYLCLNMSSEEVNNIKQDAKLKWMCPNCRNKQPKGDNTNNYVRPSTPTGLADITFNVARRKVQTKHDQVITSMGTSSDYVTRTDIQLLIREEMRSVMREFTCELTETITSRFKDITDQLSEFKDSLNFLSEHFDSLKEDIEKHSSDINTLNKENELLRCELNALSSRVRQMDQLSRSANLELQCVPEHRSENVLSIVKQLSGVVKCPVNDSDISYCSRIAKSNNNSERPRSILVKFSTPRLRDTVLAASIQYNKKNPDEKLNSSTLGIDDKKTPIFVVENLTPENRHLHAAARLRAKQLDYKYVWVRAGRVYMRKTDDSEPIFIRNIDVINNLK